MYCQGRQLVRRLLFSEFLRIDAVLCAAPSVLIPEESRPADEVDVYAIQVAGRPVIPCILETYTRDGSHQVDPIWLVTELDHFA